MPVDGNLQIAALGRLVRLHAEDGSLRRSLLAGIRAAGVPAIAATRQAALTELPKTGGLNVRTARSPIAVRTRLTGTQAGVRFVNTAKGVVATSGVSRRFGTDTGRLRHPVFGHMDRWVTQELSYPGWFTETLAREIPRFTEGVAASAEFFLASITPGVATRAGASFFGGIAASVDAPTSITGVF